MGGKSREEGEKEKLIFREEGEICSKSREEGEIGSESREKGDLPPVPPPSLFLSSRIPSSTVLFAITLSKGLFFFLHGYHPLLFSLPLPSPRVSCMEEGGGTGGKSPFSLLFGPISPSSVNINFSFSPSSLLFPPISPSSQLCLGHFSLLPILFLPPHGSRKMSHFLRSSNRAGQRFLLVF